MTDDWEDDLLNKLEEMLRNMGMPINREQLKGFMNQFKDQFDALGINPENCLLYTSPSPRDTDKSRMPSSA